MGDIENGFTIAKASTDEEDKLKYNRNITTHKRKICKTNVVYMQCKEGREGG